MPAATPRTPSRPARRSVPPTELSMVGGAGRSGPSRPLTPIPGLGRGSGRRAESSAGCARSPRSWRRGARRGRHRQGVPAPALSGNNTTLVASTGDRAAGEPLPCLSRRRCSRRRRCRGPRARCMEKQGRMDCPALPPGWKKEEVIRKSGLSAGKSDVYYFSPSGKKFRSKPQLARYLGNTVDLSSFDFRTGKMMPSKLQKNKQRLRNDSLNQNKGKPDLNTTLPIRQTASIFKQPVTKVTNHPSNKVRSDPQRVTEQPRQLFWEKRLQGLSASDVSEQIIKSMELPKGLQGVGPGNNDDTLLSAVASALHTSSAPITGQLSAAVEKNPAVWLNTSQPLCKAFIVTDDDIRKQEERVQQVRKKLEEALMADILSRAADTTKDLDVEMDNGEEA
ncbi:methyl-CpG-binding domain protein 2 [Calypte anna]|uniref:methyl-CpG-binding domain protein 2 n=1 Tax=Calypte anna TaxID=9244 RepID=UPI0011C4133E|nr:methyl-CpG-binding domain protein 2 [Calypte anna]